MVLRLSISDRIVLPVLMLLTVSCFMFQDFPRSAISPVSQDRVTNVNMMFTEQKGTPVAQAEANRNGQRK